MHSHNTSQLSYRRLPLLAVALAAAGLLAAGLMAALGRASSAQAQAPGVGPAALNATIMVSSTANAGVGTLRAAINTANSQAGPDTIGFDLTGCPCVITLNSELPTIAQALALIGPGADQLAVDGNGGGRVFNAAAPFWLADLTVQNGSVTGTGGGIRSDSPLTLTNVNVLSNTATGEGGGVYAEADMATVGGLFRGNVSSGDRGGAVLANSQLIVSDTAFISNTADGYGGAIYGDTVIIYAGWLERNYSDGEGGAIYVSTLVLTDTMILSNTASTAGGAEASDTWISGGQFVGNRSFSNDAGGLESGLLVISGTAFINNSAEGSGGGLYAEQATVMQGVYFEGNHARDQGGAVHAYAPLTVTASAFVNNVADEGGGLRVGTGSLTNVLFAGNVATSTNNGDAIDVSGSGVLRLVHVTIVGDATPNSRAIVLYSGDLAITNTIIADYAIGVEQWSGTATEDYTLFFNVTTPTTGTVGGGGHSFTGDPDFVDPGQGDYHLGRDSAALDAGTEAGVLFDYDGHTRPHNSGFDIGFDEYVQRLLFLPLVLR